MELVIPLVIYFIIGAMAAGAALWFLFEEGGDEFGIGCLVVFMCLVLWPVVLLVLGGWKITERLMRG